MVPHQVWVSVPGSSARAAARDNLWGYWENIGRYRRFGARFSDFFLGGVTQFVTVTRMLLEWTRSPHMAGSLEGLTGIHPTQALVAT